MRKALRKCAMASSTQTGAVEQRPQIVVRIGQFGLAVQCGSKSLNGLVVVAHGCQRPPYLDIGVRICRVQRYGGVELLSSLGGDAHLHEQTPFVVVGVFKIRFNPMAVS